MSIPSDMEWDKSDPLQDGYWKAGLNRYNLTHVRQLFAKRTDVEGKTDSFVLSTEGKKKEFSGLVSNKALGSSSSVVIKEETPGFSQFQQQLTIARSAKGFFLFVFQFALSFIFISYVFVVSICQVNCRSRWMRCWSSHARWNSEERATKPLSPELKISAKQPTTCRISCRPSGPGLLRLSQ